MIFFISSFVQESRNLNCTTATPRMGETDNPNPNPTRAKLIFHAAGLKDRVNVIRRMLECRGLLQITGAVEAAGGSSSS
jgi:hypothetical protein